MKCNANKKKIIIGIYVDVFTEPQSLYKTLDLLSVNTREKYSVLLLVDGSNKNIEDAFSSLSFQNISYSCTGKTHGRPACYNRLIENEKEADIYVFMECGVLVTKNWLSDLLKCLDASPTYGLVGPSSNNCWNKQGVFYHHDLTTLHLVEFQKRAHEIKQKYHDEIETLEPLYSLAEFCFVVKKEVVNSIGLADENYKDGYCWEMDYSIRAARMGLNSIWVKGVYLHRIGINSNRNSLRNKSFLQNKHLYQDKFCALKLRFEKTSYCDHCFGKDCEYFAPGELIQIKLPENPIKKESHQKNYPLVSCIMPTKGRAVFVSRAIKYFREQDYPNRELVIIYEENSDLPGNLPADNRIRFLKVGKNNSIGYKRNKACEITKGEFIAHWDDDDWYAKNRLSAQIQPITNGEGDMTGLYNTLFCDLEKWEFWSCSSELYKKMFVKGTACGTLVYKKKIWQTYARYPHTYLREDADFLVRAIKKGAKLRKIDGYQLFIYLRHPKNSWRFRPGSFLQPNQWKTVNQPPFFEKDNSFYCLLYNHPVKDGGKKTFVDSEDAEPIKIESDRFPKVSCIMPTADRREFVPWAIKGFLRQDYENKELIIIDDGTDKIVDLIPKDADAEIKYIELNRKHTVGAKRNIACSKAGGEIIIHWDDDDWMAPGWIRCQVNHLIRNNADITGLDKPYFYSPEQEKAWQYLYPANGKPWVHGGTLCYTKAIWNKKKFPGINVAEDSRFLWSNIPKKIVPHHNVELYIALVHNKNASPKRTSNSRWHKSKLEEIKRFMGNDYFLYHTSGRLFPLRQKINKTCVNIRIIPVDSNYQMRIEAPGKPGLVKDFKVYCRKNEQIIPRIIHQVWIGPNPPPWQWIDTFRRDFIKKHPHWKYQLWREEDINQLTLINRNLYDREEKLSGKVNILRYEILYQFGGIYIDADCEWINKKPLDELIDRTNFTGIFVGREDDHMAANSVIGASKNNPAMYYVIQLLRQTYEENRVRSNRETWISSGPRFFSEAILDFGITIFPPHFFYPVSWHRDNRGIDVTQFPDSYMMQYGYTTNKLYL